MQSKHSQNYEKIDLLYKGYASKIYVVRMKQDSENCDPNQSYTPNYYAIKKYFKKKNEIIDVNQYPEYQITQQLHHQNIIKFNFTFTECYPHKRQLCLAMDLMLPLHQLNQKNHEDIQYLFAQLVAALYYMHSNNYLHRDIKPSNVMITKEGILKLTDFGISRYFSPSMTPNTCTKNYRAPEIFFGMRNYDFSIDIWSLGCTLAEMYLGIPLFQGRSEIEILGSISTNLGSINQQVYPELKELENFLEIKSDCEPKLKHTLQRVPFQAQQLIEQMLQISPNKRINLENLMQSDFFQKGSQMLPSNNLKQQASQYIEKIKLGKKKIY